MSCSRIGVPRSPGERTASRRRMSGRSARIQPDAQAAPHRLADRADQHGRPVGRDAAGSAPAVDRRARRWSRRRSRRCPGGRPRRARGLARCELMVRPGRVVEVGHEVGQRPGSNAGWPARGPAVSSRSSSSASCGADRHGHQAGAGRPERLVGVRVDRRLDERAVAAADERAGEQRDRVLGADRDHDLLGRRSAGRVPCSGRRWPGAARACRWGRSPTSARWAGRSSTRLARDVGQPRQRGRQRPSRSRGTRCRAARAASRARPAAARRCRSRARCRGMPCSRRCAVGGRHRGAAEPELLGEVALGGQPGVDGDAAVEDEQPDAVGERLVGAAGRHASRRAAGRGQRALRGSAIRPL